MKSDWKLVTRYTRLWFVIAHLTCRNDSPLLAQKRNDPEVDAARLADEIFPIQSQDLDYEALYENFLQMISNPIDLNQAGEEDLRALYVLREAQVEALITHRREHGPFLSIYELQSVAGFDSVAVSRLLPFVRIADANSRVDRSLWRRVAKEKNCYLISRYEQTLQERKGYRENTDSALRYAGPPGRYLLRFRLSRPGDFSFGFVAEKDAGEALKWKPGQHYYAMDFLGYHGQVINKGNFRNLILGDYQAQFGQGLILGGGFGMGKGSESILTIRRSNIGFVPHTATGESGFFRGGAMSYALSGNFILSVFASSLRRDGNISEDSTVDDSSFITSFAISGYHRTATELKSRKQIAEHNAGIILSYNRRSLEAGLVAHETLFSSPIVRTPTVYNQFNFRGRENSNLGMFLNYNNANVSFFGEVAQTVHHGAAVTGGILASLSPQLDASLSYRSFSRSFISFYSNALAENTSTQNETGIYWGLKYTFSRKYSLAGYLDLFRFPWLRYRAYAPGQGSEWLVRFNYQPSKRILFYLQAREEAKDRNQDEVENLYHLKKCLKRNYWINCDAEVSPRLSLKTRLQFNTQKMGSLMTKGMALMQDLSFDLARFSISLRYVLFDTDTYDNRIYAYERDATLAFSFPAYYGAGVRDYVLVQYKASRHVDFWVRWAHTRLTDRETIGSGAETILGNVVDDLKLQARIRL